MSKLIIVSNRLPVSVKKIDGKLEFTPSIGGLATALASYVDGGSNRWIGWPGIAAEEVTDKERAAITAELRRRNCYPVFLTHKQIDQFYNGYSNKVLWPVFHHLELAEGQTDTNWRAYKEVNKLYAEETLRLSQPDDAIWVHDYQLLLLPEQLRKERPQTHIGFFLHIPWPSPQDFSEITYGDELLRGVLGADLIGTHTTSYADNFLACCARAEIGIVAPRKVVLPTRVVRVTDFPIGINYEKFADAAKSKDVRLEYEKLRYRYHGKKVILSIDRLDPSKGIVPRLEAYRTLLKENPSLATKVVFIMQAMPSRTDIPAYQKLRTDVDTLIEDINTTYGRKGWKPLIPIFSPLPFAQYAALYQRADIAFITPVRDGMNLVAKEYLASHPLKNGVLVLSETAGAAEELKDAVLVNPNNPRSLVDGLKKALSMREADTKNRVARMQRYLRTHTVDKWANSFLETMESAVATPNVHITRSLIGAPERAVVSDYHQATRRLLIMGYDGTLQPLMHNPEDAKPSPRLKAALSRLGSDPKNKVVILSGRDKETLDQWLGELPITLVAEFGAFIRKPGDTWRRTVQNDGSWKSEVNEILIRYAARTPGSMVEYKEQALVWHYRNASSFTAQKNLVAIKRLLAPIAKREKLAVVDSQAALQIRHLDISKAHLVQEWLLKDQDFVLEIGDDKSDEEMFANAPAGTITVKVGRERSAARWRLPNPASVLKLLRQL